MWLVPKHFDNGLLAQFSKLCQQTRAIKQVKKTEQTARFSILKY
jgi:hypothetical protein